MRRGVVWSQVPYGLKSGALNLESYGWHWRGTRTAFPLCGVSMFSAVAVIKLCLVMQGG